MDHAEEYLLNYAQLTADGYDIKSQLEAGKKISDCVGYDELKAYVKAVNALRDYLGWDKIKVIDLVE